MPLDREKTLQAAQRYVDRKRYDKALDEYQKIIREDPKDARTLLKVGDLQARVQAYGDAIATYDHVGQHYAAQGFALKAIAVYKQVRELIRKHAPELADSYAHVVPKLAELYTHLGLPNDALGAYDEIATHHLRAGRDRDAIDVFAKMVELDANNPLPRLRLAEACCRVGDLDPAVNAFWTAAELLLGMQRRDDALKVIERVLHFRPDPKYARMAAELYLQRRTREDGLLALSKLQFCFQANPKDLETLGLLAEAFKAINAESKAVEVYKEMARIARDQGQRDLFEQLLAHLQTVAPNDEQVRALAGRQSGPASLVAVSSVPPSLDDSDLEILEEVPRGSAPIAGDAGPRPVASHDFVPVEAPSIVEGEGLGDRASAPEVMTEEQQGTASEEVAAELREQARKAMVDAESFRKLHLYTKAVEALRLAVDYDPGSVEIRDRLRQVLEESGKLAESAHESVELAEIYLAHQDRESAVGLCYAALQIAPDSHAAQHLLRQLGVSSPAVPAWACQDDALGPQLPTRQRGPGAEEAASSAEPEAATEAAASTSADRVALGLERVDDPFGELDQASLQPLSAGVASQPELDQASSQPLSVGVASQPEAAEARVQPERPAESADRLELTAAAEPEQSVGSGGQVELTAAAAPERPPESIGPLELSDSLTGDELESTAEYASAQRSLTQGLGPGWGASSEEKALADSTPAPEEGFSASEPGHFEAVEEALEEAEFFASRGLYDDARGILNEQLSRTPNHPLLLERLSELGHLPSGESGTIERSQLDLSRPESVQGDRAYDLAASLDALDAIGDQARLGVARSRISGSNDAVDVEQVFAKFKEGVRQQVAENDAATHYDLGVAYKEMGLVSDAVQEFEMAARDVERECNCYAMIGLVYLDQGWLDQAESAFLRGLEAERKAAEQEMALYYDLGNVKEMSGQRDEALYYFKRIARRDPGFRDVKDRIVALEPRPADSAAHATAEDDEFDAVFDKLFGSN
ncbi:tetratricopeptide repeat protein [Myxococcota bacterium]